MQIEQLAKFTLHQGSIYALIHGPGDKTFLSGGSEGIVVQWNLDEPTHGVALAKVDGQVFSLLLLKEKNHLVIGTMSGGLHVIDLNLKKEIHYITYHEQSLFDIKFYEEHLFVASKDGTLSIWSAHDYSLQRAVTISDLSLRMIAFHPFRREVMIASSDNQCYLLDLENWRIKAVLEGPENSVFSVCYFPDGEKLLAGSRDAQLYLYDVDRRTLEKQIKAHLYTINHIQFIPEMNIFATASRDKTVRIWNAEDLSLLKAVDNAKYGGHINSVNRLLWIPSASCLLSASDDRSIIAWRIYEEPSAN